MTTREDCVAADRKDPLAALKARFELPPGVLYMDGNSLGVMPKARRRPRRWRDHAGMGHRLDPQLEHRRLVRIARPPGR